MVNADLVLCVGVLVHCEINRRFVERLILIVSVGHASTLPLIPWVPPEASGKV